MRQQKEWGGYLEGWHVKHACDRRTILALNGKIHETTFHAWTALENRSGPILLRTLNSNARSLRGLGSVSLPTSQTSAWLCLELLTSSLLRLVWSPIRDIGILVVNCILFNPTPSVSVAWLWTITNLGVTLLASYNLGLRGMGCSAGLISIDLAKDLLKILPNTYALVVSRENITLNWYFGDNRSMLVSNPSFRMSGAAAILASNRWSGLIAGVQSTN